MKLSQKQKILAEKDILSAKLSHILDTIGIDKIYQSIVDDLKNDIKHVDDEIEDEQNYADENKTGAYRSAGTEARKAVKYLKGVKKKKQQLLKQFNDFLKMKKKVDEL